LDGIRAYWNGHQLLSRQGKALHPPKKFLRLFPPFPLDGELWIGRGKFQQTASIVLSQTPDTRWEQVTYQIFEAPHSDGNFTLRIAKVQDWFARHPNPNVAIIPQHMIHSIHEAKIIMRELAKKGAEGVMLKNPALPYIPARHAGLLKLKPSDDMEGTVIGYKEGNGKYSGMVGALHVRLADGKTFYLGSGLSDEERKNPPPIGTVVTFKHHGFTTSGLPRFASFWRIRP